MGVVRNRSESAKKAAQTNQSKRSDFYAFIGSEGGKVKGIAKGIAKLSDEARQALARRASRMRYGIKEDALIQYVVTAPGSPTYTTSTRQLARQYKRLIRDDSGARATIKRIEWSGDPFEGGFILSSKEVW